MNQAGEILLHRNMKATPEPLLKAITPYRAEQGANLCRQTATGDEAHPERHAKAR
jgi:hypothetical protein